VINLKQHPEELHEVPYGTADQHSESPSWVCRPSVAAEEGWWQRVYRHHVIDAPYEPESDEWAAIRDANRKRTR
jgi:hypothetical protein